MKELTESAIDRQNILNNKFALNKIQEHVGFVGMFFNDEYKFTTNQVELFFEVDNRTISRYLKLYEQELKHNGYEVIKGKVLKEFKTQFGHLLEEGIKAPQLGVFNFRAILNLAMLLVESENAKLLRSKVLDIVIDSINNKIGGSTKYINQRDEDFLIAIFKEPKYRKEFTSALSKFIDMGNFKYSFFTDKIYQSIFKEDAQEYKKILALAENEKIRDTLYAEVLKLIASFETGIAFELEKKFKELNRKLTQGEAETLIKTFAIHPLYKPLIDDACIKMASRDYAFRNVIHTKIEAYLKEVPEADYERFLGEKSKTIEERIEENKEVFIRLKDR
jgi:hypothetical protein